MSALWGLAGTVLTVFSIALLVAGLQGREGILRIGKEAATQGSSPSEARVRSVNATNVVLGLVGVLVGLAAIIVFAI